MKTNKEQPLISIIVPIYNVEDYLPECIDSILEQSYRNLEVILVDDGSFDACGEICDKYREKDSRIVVIHQKNRGQGPARNAGLEIAKGEYIGFVDSDDFILPKMYEILVNRMLEYDADISACTRFVVEEDAEGRKAKDEEKWKKAQNRMQREVQNRPWEKAQERTQNVLQRKTQSGTQTETQNESGEAYEFIGYTAVKELLQEHQMLKNAVWEKLYKKKLFQKIKFRNIYAEDMDVMYRLFYIAERIVFSNTRQYGYRLRKGSTMLSPWTEKKDNAFHEICKQCIAYFEERQEEELRKAAICWYIQLGIENYRRMGNKERKRMQKEMLKYCKPGYLWKTDYRIRKKIEFYIFARWPGFHCFCCNVVRRMRRGI